MSKLDEIIKIADIHLDKIELAVFRLRDIFPLNEAKVSNFSEQEVMLVELLISRFAKLQDYIGRILINFVLKNVGDYEDRMTMIDKLNKLERLEIIESAAIWEQMREARNHIAHEYPDEPALTAKYLNQIFDLTPYLIQILNRIKRYIK
jgi:hypothetical protein